MPGYWAFPSTEVLRPVRFYENRRRLRNPESNFSKTQVLRRCGGRLWRVVVEEQVRPLFPPTAGIRQVNADTAQNDTDGQNAEEYRLSGATDAVQQNYLVLEFTRQHGPLFEPKHGEHCLGETPIEQIHQPETLTRYFNIAITRLYLIF